MLALEESTAHSQNLCMECGIDMGEYNPRQLCGETRCEMKDNLDLLNIPTMSDQPTHVKCSRPPSFLSDKNFEYISSAKRAMDWAMDWADLPLHTVFLVHSILSIQTKWGMQSILELNWHGIQDMGPKKC